MSNTHAKKTATIKVNYAIITSVLILLISALTNLSGCLSKQKLQTSEQCKMEPKIINKDAFVIMGTRSAITPKNESSETYGIIWQDFESYRSRVQPYSTDQKYYGVSFTTSKEGALDYLAGMAVSEGTTAPENLAIRKIPATRYAVFECPIHEIGQTKQYIFSQWLPSSPYKISTSPAFEQYPPEGQDPSPVFIYIPISEK